MARSFSTIDAHPVAAQAHLHQYLTPGFLRKQHGASGRFHMCFQGKASRAGKGRLLRKLRVLLCCSYVWREGRLLPVPATKADVFRSRALSGGDKRSLMRFLSACAGAARGTGHLKARSARKPS